MASNRNLMIIFLVTATVILAIKADDFYENNHGRNGFRNDFDDGNGVRRFNRGLGFNQGFNGGFGSPFNQGIPRFGNPGFNSGFGFPNQEIGFPNQEFGFPNKGFGFPNQGFGFPNQGINNPRFGNNNRIFD